MIKINIIGNYWQSIPLKEDLPIIEITDEEFEKLHTGEIIVENGKLVDNSLNIQLEQELQDLYNWFEEYDNQVKQYERSVRLGIEFDKDIAELDAQADINAARITEIRNLLKNSQN